VVSYGQYNVALCVEASLDKSGKGGRGSILAFAQHATSARTKRETSNEEWPIHSKHASSSKMRRGGVAPRILAIESRIMSSRGKRVTPSDGDRSGIRVGTSMKTTEPCSNFCVMLKP
jgi:hypothetical protein